MPRLKLVIFPVLNRTKPQAPLLVVPFPSIASCFRLATMLLQEPGTLISQLDPSWFGLRLFSRARICDLTSKALKASPQLGTLDLHLVTAVESHGEHRRWQIQPCTYRSMVYSNVLGAVGTSTRADACALQAYAQLPAPSAPSWCLAFLECRQSKDTQHITSKSIFAHTTARKCF